MPLMRLTCKDKLEWSKESKASFEALKKSFMYRAYNVLTALTHSLSTGLRTHLTLAMVLSRLRSDQKAHPIP